MLAREKVKKENTRKQSISLQITIILLISIGLILLVSVAIISLSLNSFYENQKRYIDNKFTKLFISLISFPMERFDYYGVEKNCQEFLGEEIVKYVYVYDNSGFLINQSVSEKSIKPYGLIEEVIYDIENSRNEIIGKVKIGYDFSSYYFSLIKVKIILFLNMLLIIVFITFIIFYILSNKLARPLSELLNLINKISSGDYSNKLNINSEDEIGDIARAFNEMSTKLNSSISLIDGIVKNLPSAIIFINKEFRVNLLNKMAEKLFDIDLQNSIHKLIYDLNPYFIDFEDEFLKIYRNKKTIIISQKFIEKGKLKDSYHTITMSPLFSIEDKDNVEGIIIKIDDETENVKKTNIINQMQRMESIQLLGSGIAHDFNNILGSITGTISLISNDLKYNQKINKKDLLDYIDILTLSTQKASLVVNQLMSFAKKKDLKFSIINISKCIEDIKKICEHSFDKSIEIFYDNTYEKALIWGIETQIEQALLNLCINASHALTIMKKEGEKKGGILQLSLNKIDREGKQYWQISIKDNGVGIPKENLTKIFDPFFSTKDKSLSSGLGLSLVYNIIENHGGYIEVNSEVGIGTEFKIHIPVYLEEDSREIIENKEKTIKPKFKGKKVLLVDDDDVLRNVMKRILGKFDLEVIESNDPTLVLELYNKVKEEISIIILDLIMPKLSGYELYNLLEENYKINEKNIKVILTSGLSLDERLDKLSKNKNIHILLKPYNIEDVNKLMNELFIEN